MTGVERLTDPVDAVGESPVWRAAEGALYWTDITARRNRTEFYKLLQRHGIEAAVFKHEVQK